MHSTSSVSSPFAGFVGLPVEVILDILEGLPTIEALSNVVRCNSYIYDVFDNYHCQVVYKVLKNEIPEDLYTHAMVAQLALEGALTMPNLDSVKLLDIDSHVSKIRYARDFAPSLRFSLRSAISVSKTYQKVKDLTNLCVRECGSARDQDFPALQTSLNEKKPSASELNRISQAIYLFDILAAFSRNFYFERPNFQTYYVNYYLKLGELHARLVDIALAPWEMYQVIGIQAFFRRSLHGFRKYFHFSGFRLYTNSFLERDMDYGERFLPNLMSRGIDFIHRALCTVEKSELDNFLKPYVQEALDKPQHALGMVLSRGAHNTWTRKQPRALDQYSPFWTGDEKGMKGWEKLEAKQLTLFREDIAWMDMFAYDLAVLEGRLDLWSAGLWDEARWEDILGSLVRPELEWWSSLMHHPEPMSLGIINVRDYEAFMPQETMEG